MYQQNKNTVNTNFLIRTMGLIALKKDVIKTHPV